MHFVPVYWLLKVLTLDEGKLLVCVPSTPENEVIVELQYLILQIWAPKFVQGLLASITDVAVRRLARNILGERYVSTAVSHSLQT